MTDRAGCLGMAGLVVALSVYVKILLRPNGVVQGGKLLKVLSTYREIMGSGKPIVPKGPVRKS
jgi:hypothetical protein